LEGFAAFLGLVEIEWKSEKILDRRFILKKRSLLNEAVVFHSGL